MTTGGVRSLVTSLTDSALGSWLPVRGKAMAANGLWLIMLLVCKKLKKPLRVEILLALLRLDSCRALHCSRKV